MAAADARARSSRRQLPITGSAHKAGIVGDARHAAIVARLDVTAERGCAARLDRAHHAPFDAAQMSGVGRTIGVAMATQNVRDLEANARPAPCHGRLSGRRDFQTSVDRTGFAVARIIWVATCV